jgi:hypothetical protein
VLVTAIGRESAAAAAGARPTLRLRDAGSGTLRAVPVDARRLLSVAWAPTAADLLNTLRPALVADLIRRVVELHGAQVDVRTSGDVPDLLPYNVHPATPPLSPGAADVAVGAAAPGRVVVEVGPAIGPELRAADPLALRLLLLAAPRATAVVVDAEGLAAASLRLAGWRQIVVRDASGPSAAIPPRYLGALHARAADDLDSPGLLDLVDRIAGDDDVRAGSRLEFLLYADRVLGLDLAAGLGSGSR